MKLGYIGLGKMGKNMVEHLLEQKFEIVAWNRSPEPLQYVVAKGAVAATDFADMVQKLEAPRTIWVMLPAGDVTMGVLKELSELVQPGDTVIDGANSFYKNTIECNKLFEPKGINFFDVGVSNGPGGARTGACLMVGGKKEWFTKYEELFKAIAAPGAYRLFPGIGGGHFVKMVHNGIEYGMMQSIAEGFAVLKASHYDHDLQQIAELYNNHSVISSRLVDWLAQGYAKFGSELTDISGTVAHSGEGQWTVETAKELGIPTPAIADALQFRIDSTQNPSYTGKVVSLLRFMFGGHNVKAEK